MRVGPWDCQAFCVNGVRAFLSLNRTTQRPTSVGSAPNESISTMDIAVKTSMRGIGLPRAQNVQAMKSLQALLPCSHADTKRTRFSPRARTRTRKGPRLAPVFARAHKKDQAQPPCSHAPTKKDQALLPCSHAQTKRTRLSPRVRTRARKGPGLAPTPARAYDNGFRGLGGSSRNARNTLAQGVIPLAVGTYLRERLNKI